MFITYEQATEYYKISIENSSRQIGGVSNVLNRVRKTVPVRIRILVASQTTQTGISQLSARQTDV